jgi:hypothetical protein
MKPSKHKLSKASFTQSDIEFALRQWVERSALETPKTDQEIVQMLSKMDLSNVPKPDPARFERLIQERLVRKQPAPKPEMEEQPPVPPTGPERDKPKSKKRAQLPSNPPPLPASFDEFCRRLQKGKAGYFSGRQMDRLTKGVTYEGVALQAHDTSIGWRFSRIGEGANRCLPLRKVYECLVKAGNIQQSAVEPKPGRGEPALRRRESSPITVSAVEPDFWAFKAR